MGTFPMYTKIGDLGTAYFLNSQKKAIFEDREFYGKLIEEVVGHIENMIKYKHPCRFPESPLKIVFLPNFIGSKNLK